MNRSDLFHSRSFRIFLAVCAALLVLMIGTAGFGGAAPSNILSFFATPMQRVSTLVTNNAAVSARDASASREELLAENSELRRQISELQSQLVDYYDLKKENAQLYEYLDMKELNPDFQLVAASVIGRDPNRFYTFTIDRGTSAGVAVNDPVVTSEGVVGWVSGVNSISAEVTTLLSPDTRMGGTAEVGATDKQAGESGVISTDLTLSDQGLVKLGYLTADTQAKAGDIVVTSGLGSIYPQNLKIGTITSVEHEESDVSLYALVEPFVDVTEVRDVMVITSFLGQGEAMMSGPSAASGEDGGAQAAASSAASSAAGDDASSAGDGASSAGGGA